MDPASAHLTPFPVPPNKNPARQYPKKGTVTPGSLTSSSAWWTPHPCTWTPRW